MTHDYDVEIRFGCAVAEAYAKHEQAEGAIAQVASAFPRIDRQSILLAWRAVDAHACLVDMDEVADVLSRLVAVAQMLKRKSGYEGTFRDIESARALIKRIRPDLLRASA